MQSSFDILSGFYKVIKPVIGPVITGSVIIGDEQMGDQKENVTLNLLNNPVDYIQQGIVNVNVHVMGLENDKVNQKRMKQIVDLLFPLLNEAEHYFSDHQITLHLSIDDDKGVFKDQENKGKYFYNIRVNYITF